MFEEHIAEVKRSVPEERLLVFDVSKDGWVRIASARSFLSPEPSHFLSCCRSLSSLSSLLLLLVVLVVLTEPALTFCLRSSERGRVSAGPAVRVSGGGAAACRDAFPPRERRDGDD
eukprot:COSAG04_NODE_805_length_10154_cov_9.105122_16_plen_116_part_00